MNDPGLSLLAATTLFLLLLGGLEAWSHRRRLRAIGVRVHVNGTRGKSSVTRLVAAGLRAQGFCVVAKTTGTLPRLIRPDGSEDPIHRVSRPNVIEQVDVVRRARRMGADVLVVECMALEPFLQWVSAAHLVRPTHGVLTNIRADHLEVMGPTVEDVARALAGSVPYRGKLFATRGEHDALLTKACEDRHSELVFVEPEGQDAVTPEELRALPYIEHAENVAMALRVCRDLGVSRDVALSGMERATPDPGALTVAEAHLDGHAITFVNGFAANDPESTQQVWELALGRAGAGKKHIALVNCRTDRPERSKQLGRAILGWTPADEYVVVGTGTHFFLRAAERGGLDRRRLHVVEGHRAANILAQLARLSGSDSLVVGLGNIGGVGLELIEALRHREGPSHSRDGEGPRGRGERPRRGEGHAP
jgi:poly-gamma-glutamate synthase PgsB/CapB